MKLLIPCAKGCGEAIEVGDEEIALATSRAQPLRVQHEVCPRDRLVHPTYKLVVTVTRVPPRPEDADDGWEEEHAAVLASVPGKVVAATFADASKGLWEQAQAAWVKVLGMMPTIEVGIDDGNGEA